MNTAYFRSKNVSEPNEDAPMRHWLYAGLRNAVEIPDPLAADIADMLESYLRARAMELVRRSRPER